MKRYFVELSYDGTNYHGWQLQPNAPTVQATLEKAFSTLLKDEISLTGAGRTDTGVHASYFVAHFDHEREDIDQQEKLVFKLNGILPEDIAIHAVSKVDSELHARFSATYRHYIYSIRRTKPLFNRPFCYYYYGVLDIERMNEACEVLKEYTDFTSFSKLHTDVKTNDCSIMEAFWTEHEDGWDFEIKADRFLRNMVRSIAGTMMEIGAGKMDLNGFRAVIEAKDRGMAGTSVPAKGLFLVDIGY
ncbi:MAG: tRNA pseudouridine(38-40) synthase TruA [Bacteroidales bacterium]|nr:tRNA pseudouridine(38-40) synthase TruA [Bacteroidales bacterium]MDT8430927.1 tRNA pseudouridine(38-40) synthase TruA [Bacteroidales bacterium]